MSWKKKEIQMVDELNEKVFSKDPLRVISSALSSIDVVNSNYIKELKYREGYHSKAFDNWFIEKIKYDFLINQAKIDKKIPGYICKFNDGKYIAWNLNKVKEPKWYVKPLPKTSKIKGGDKTFVDKDVGDLMIEDGVELI
tara:strand:- start:88 stop:507 length:420 start_codon:yes stop_codon:yes gene_type:complete